VIRTRPRFEKRFHHFAPSPPASPSTNTNIINVIFCLCRKKKYHRAFELGQRFFNPEEKIMEAEQRIETNASASLTERTGGIVPGIANGQSANAAPVTPAVTANFGDPGKKRRAKIAKIKAKLQREIARDSTASRKERDGQLFVWGAMVEGIYRDGNAQEREQLRQWAKRKLTDRRHLKRAECGFARIEDEAAEEANA
jgi:hypothetical protein